jgi:hypothetical protein
MAYPDGSAVKIRGVAALGRFEEGTFEVLFYSLATSCGIAVQRSMCLESLEDKHGSLARGQSW